MSNVKINYKKLHPPIESVEWARRGGGGARQARRVADGLRFDNAFASVLLPWDAAEEVLEACLQMVREAKRDGR